MSSLTKSNIFQGSRGKNPKVTNVEGIEEVQRLQKLNGLKIQTLQGLNGTQFDRGWSPKKIQGVNGLNKVQGLRSLRIWQSPIVTKFEWFQTYLGATTFEWFEKVHTLQKVNGLRNNKGWMSWKYLSCTVRKSPTVTRSEWFVQSWKLQGLNGVHTSKRSQKLHCYQMFNGLNKSQRYKEVTMTHSHIRRMKAWPYRQKKSPTVTKFNMNWKKVHGYTVWQFLQSPKDTHFEWFETCSGVTKFEKHLSPSKFEWFEKSNNYKLMNGGNRSKVKTVGWFYGAQLFMQTEWF